MPKNKPLRLIVDTNLWVSFIISNKLNPLDPLLFTGDLRLLFNADLFAEIQETIAKQDSKNALGQMLL